MSKISVKRFLAIVLALMVMLAMMLPTTALAAESETYAEQDAVVAQSIDLEQIPAEENSVMAAAATTHISFIVWEGNFLSPNGGINRNITIKVNNVDWRHVNGVTMTDRFGKVVWESGDAIPNNGQRTFWCGPDVYRLTVGTRNTASILPFPVSVQGTTINYWG